MKLNPHIRAILRGGQHYRDGSISLEGLQQSLSGEMAAMEGDVPREVFAAVTKAEAWIESARFMFAGSPQRTEVERILAELETVIFLHYSVDSSDEE